MTPLLTPKTPIRPLFLRDLRTVASATPAWEPAATAAERELVFYFGVADAEMGRRSNVPRASEASMTGVVGRLEEVDDDDLERRVDAAHAVRLIERRLVLMPDASVGILAATYEAIAWPGEILHRFGKLAGVVVRIMAGTYGDPIAYGHEPRTAERILACCRVGEGDRELTLAHDEAKALYRRALIDYDRTRGAEGVTFDACVVPGADR